MALGLMEHPELPVALAHPALLVLPVHPATREVLLGHRVLQAHRELMVAQAHLEPPALRVQQALPVQVEAMAPPELREQMA